MDKIELRRPEVLEIESLISTLLDRHQSGTSPEFLQRSMIYAQRLPERLRDAAALFRVNEPHGAFLVAGLPIHDDQIGNTPAHWAIESDPRTTARQDIFFVLCASLLGDVFGWASQQGGQLIHDVLPIRGHENLQINSASSATLLWHTEDAFHPYRADYVGLMCLRNPDQIQTTTANVRDVKLDTSVTEVLAQPRFVLRPDEAHLPNNGGGEPTTPAQAAAIARSYQRVEEMLRNPPKVSILFGDPTAPYIRLDSDAVDQSLDDPEAMSALAILMQGIDEQLTGFTLNPGDVIFIDNYTTVHGREPFRARFDGTDRWLKRVNVTRDLRRSRDARVTVTDRILY